MTSKNKLLFNVNVAPSKIKLIALHPKKQWVTLLTMTNSFFLWNYRQKILIKSFHCSTFDSSKNLEIRQIVFYDRESLPYPSNKNEMRNILIFISATKIFLYDYVTDAIKEINDKQMEQKGIRKVCAYSESKICVTLTDGSFKILDNKDLYTKNVMSIKTIRGYHTKSINWLIAYCQNENEMPRIITVSGSDGLMACWNIQTIIHTNTQNANPSFKFLMKSRNDSNNGQQIFSLQYDNSSYRLLTITESYITIWSTMTGIQLKRLKNHKYREIAFMNHFAMGSSCFLAHSGNYGLSILRLHYNDYEAEECLNIRSFDKESDDTICCLKNLPRSPSEIFLMTNYSLFVVEVSKFYRCSYGYHSNFLTHLTTVNSKQFVVKGDNSLRANIHFKQLEHLTFEEDILFNCFFLSFENGWIYFNLIQMQFENMLYEQRKYKMKQVRQNSLLKQVKGSQTVIQISFNGRQFFIFNKQLGYFEIWSEALVQEQSLLGDETNRLDFYSKLQSIGSGNVRDVAWHQFKNQIVAIKSIDKNGTFVEFVQQKKGGIFNRGSDKILKLSSEGVQECAVLYEKSLKTNQYEIIYKSKPISTKLYRVLNLGCLFGYSVERNGTQVLQFLGVEQNNKEIEGTACFPQRVYISFCESYQIYSYDGYFIIYRVMENGSQSYFRSVQQTILHGLFWEKFFFFSTKNQIYFLQITVADLIIIKIADATDLGQKQQWQIPSNDDLQPSCIIMPQGQLQLMGVINYNLMVLNHMGVLSLINLKGISYVQFCVGVVCGDGQKISSIWKNSNNNLKKSMKETMTVYGLSAHEMG